MFSFAIRRRWGRSSSGSERAPRYPGVCETVGDTPVVELRNLLPRADCEMVLKLECRNPGGSVKDRPAVHIIDEAERTGKLREHGTIIESSSGNFGVSLAMIGASRGYRVIVLVDPKTSRTKINVLHALGAEIDVVTEKDDTGAYHKTRIRRANQLAEEIENSFRPDQCSNPLNRDAHYRSTAMEILEQTRGEVDVIVVPTSTGGQVSGVAATIAEHAPHIRVVAADAFGSGIFSRNTKPYFTPGMGMAWTPIQINLADIAAVHLVKDENSFAGARLLARNEGLLSGGSTGAVLYVMTHYALKGGGIRVLGIQSDSGDHYLDTIYSDMWLEERGFRTDIGLDEFVERARRHAPMPAEELGYQTPDRSLVPEEWFDEAMKRRGSNRDG